MILLPCQSCAKATLMLGASDCPDANQSDLDWAIHHIQNCKKPEGAR